MKSVYDCFVGPLEFRQIPIARKQIFVSFHEVMNSGLIFNYRPYTKYGEDNVFKRVCLSVHKRGEDASQMDAPPRMDAPPCQWMHPPPPQKTDGQEGVVRILLECILVEIKFASLKSIRESNFCFHTDCHESYLDGMSIAFFVI